MSAASEKSDGFTASERAAMKARAAELRAEARSSKKAEKAAADLEAVLAKIAEMPEADRILAERLHRLVGETAPELAPKTWYGMPAYANSAGKVVCFFQSGAKYESRYCTFGFQDAAALDDGGLWATSFAVTPDLSQADEDVLRALVRRAVS